MSAWTGEIANMNMWQHLGHGVHSVVWRTRKTGNSSSDRRAAEARPDPLGDLPNWVAVKVVYDKPMPPHDIVREASVLKNLSHANIISLLEFVCGASNAPYALYMPLIPLPLTALLFSPLFTSNPITGPYSAFAKPVLKSQPQQSGTTGPFVVVAKSLIFQLLLAISYLHSQDPPISHRDVSPGNVLIDSDGTVKLVDFGIAWTEPQSQQATLSSTTSAQGPSSTYLYKEWRETPQEMCCQVATGPHRAPELLFSPPVYSAMAADLWSLGTTIAQFFTPLQLNPSKTPQSSPTPTTEEVDEITSSPFIIPEIIRKNIDYHATWERRTLFDPHWGELCLIWSIFQLRGTPNKEICPSFSSLVATSRIEFREAVPQPLHTALPHLPTSTELSGDGSPGSLIDGFLAYEPPSRLAAAQALQHPWFSADLLLPPSYPCSDVTEHAKGMSWLTVWEGSTLADWLEPALVQEARKVTQT